MQSHGISKDSRADLVGDSFCLTPNAIQNVWNRLCVRESLAVHVLEVSRDLHTVSTKGQNDSSLVRTAIRQRHHTPHFHSAHRVVSTADGVDHIAEHVERYTHDDCTEAARSAVAAASTEAERIFTSLSPETHGDWPAGGTGSEDKHAAAEKSVLVSLDTSQWAAL